MVAIVYWWSYLNGGENVESGAAVLALVALVAGPALRTSQYIYYKKHRYRQWKKSNLLTGSPFGPSNPIGPWKIKENVSYLSLSI